MKHFLTPYEALNAWTLFNTASGEIIRAEAFNKAT